MLYDGAHNFEPTTRHVILSFDISEERDKLRTSLTVNKDSAFHTTQKYIRPSMSLGLILGPTLTPHFLK